MKKEIIKDFSKIELLEKINAEKANLSKLKMNHSISPIENPTQLRFSRRNIARLNIELAKR